MEATTQSPKTMNIRQLKNFRYNPEWETIKDVGPIGSSSTLELKELLMEDESCINGAEMLKRAEVSGNLAGQSIAELLLENHKSIPEEWRQFALVFAGTVRRGLHDLLFVPVLYWEDNLGDCSPDCDIFDRGEKWVLEFYWIGDYFHFGTKHRLVLFGNE